MSFLGYYCFMRTNTKTSNQQHKLAKLVNTHILQGEGRKGEKIPCGP
jgi:hypothetical protein